MMAILAIVSGGLVSAIPMKNAESLCVAPRARMASYSLLPFFPLAFMIHFKIVFKILQQFFKARFGDVEQSYAGLYRGGRGRAAFDDV